MPFKQNKIPINLRKVKGFEPGFHTLLPPSLCKRKKRTTSVIRFFLFVESEGFEPSSKQRTSKLSTCLFPD